MVSKLLNTLERGAAVMRHNSRLLFIGFLLFAFPLIFLLISERFFDTAYTNIQTAERQSVGSLHDALENLLLTSTTTNIESVAAFSQSQKEQNSYINEIRIVERTPEGLRVITSLFNDKIGTQEEATDIFDSTLSAGNNSFIFEFSRGRERIWQAVRPVQYNGHQYFIFSEHSFGKLDEVMTARKQESYFGLIFVFIFLIALAYWLNRLTNYEQRYRKLVQTLDERDLFINMIAHEFRTPLTAIRGYASMLDDSETLKQNERGHLEKITISTERLLALVNDFLEVARLQSGKMSITKSPLDVGTLCVEVVAALEATANEKGLALLHPPVTTPILLNTDHQRLYQALQNLVSNAIKYTDKGSVELSIEESPLSVSIRIKDTGMGISAEDQQKLFAPFARVGGVEKSGITGTGLGMWITKRLIELMGGSISVESIKNVGTHVIVTFKR